MNEHRAPYETSALPVAALTDTQRRFERKWRMSFDEFSLRCRDRTLGQDSFSWEVEQDFWAWEQAETLLKHFRDASAA